MSDSEFSALCARLKKRDRRFTQVKELAGMLDAIPRTGSVGIPSQVRDGMLAILRVVRQGMAYEFGCNYPGIPESHKDAAEVRLIGRILDLADAFTQRRLQFPTRFSRITSEATFDHV